MPGLSENAISFFGAGGHKHDGVSSTLISTDSYSLFDFNPGYRGAQSRIATQVVNQTALEDWVLSIVNTKVLAPAGIKLDPNTLSGKSIRANTITATELQANTITADEIAAGSITADELSANLVLVNNVIMSNNYNGTIAANGAITATGNAGWAITSFGSAEFSSASIRGAIDADSVTTPGLIISNTGAISSNNFNVTANGFVTANNATIYGYIEATAGFIGGIDIDGGSIQSTDFDANNGFQINSNGYAVFNEVSVKGNLQFANSVTPGTFNNGGALSAGSIGGITISGSSIQSTDFDANNGFQINSDGTATFHEVTVRGYINAESGFIGGIDIDSGSVQTTNYVAGLTGFQILSNGYANFNDMLIGNGLKVGNACRLNYAFNQNGTTVGADGGQTIVLIRADANGDNANNYPLRIINYNAGLTMFRIRYDGLFETTQAPVRFSDIRLKNNIEESILGLDFINDLKPKSYFMQATEEYSSLNTLKRYGLIAQDVKEVYEKYTDSFGGWHLSDENDPESYQQLGYEEFISPLIKAVQELSAKVTLLETRLQGLEEV